MQPPMTAERSLGRAARNCGFTLVELLVVLLLIGLFVGMVSAITRPDDRALLHIEARRLAALLDFAAATSRMTGKPIAWTVDGTGYRFWRFHEDAGWAEVRDADLLRARTLPQGMMIADLVVESMRPQGIMRLEFIPYAPPLSFTIEMSLGAERYAVAGSPVGEVRGLPSAGATNGDTALR